MANTSRAGFVNRFVGLISPSQNYAETLTIDVEADVALVSLITEASSISFEIPAEGNLATFPGYAAAADDPASPLFFESGPVGGTSGEFINPMEFDNSGGSGGTGNANIADVMKRISLGF